MTRSPRLAPVRSIAALLTAFALVGGCSSGDNDGEGAAASTTTTSEGTTTTTRPTVTNTALGATIHFTDITESAGITHVQHALRTPPNCFFSPPGDETQLGCIEERMTGGVAAADYDADGLTDLYFTRLDGPGLLYRNTGSATFVDVTAAAGLDTLDSPNNGVAFADLDNNGFPDLFVTTIAAGRFYLFMNDGKGHFTEEAVDRGAALADDTERGGMSVSVGDYDRDGFLDLHTTAWEFSRDAGGSGGSGDPIPHARLLHNLGDDEPGHFEDVTEAAGVMLDRASPEGEIIGSAPSFSFASAFVDLDTDGWQDLAVASDFGTAQLFWNNGDGTFSDGTDIAGIGTEGNAMGSTFGDYDADGDLDWFVTAIMDSAEFCGTSAEACTETHTGNRLYRNAGDRTFEDVTDVAGVRDARWGWGAVFADIDNDGSLDIAATNGQKWVGPGYEEKVDPATTAYFEVSAPRLWRNNHEGPFTDVAADTGFRASGPGKGVAVADLDNDGDLDIVTANNGGRPGLFRNDGGNSAGWLRVDLSPASGSNHDSYGAIITVETDDGYVQRREVGSMSNFLGQSERTAHFGLGSPARRVREVRVEWPAKGQVTSLNDLDPNQQVLISEPG